jgi:hypothetical protein
MEEMNSRNVTRVSLLLGVLSLGAALSFANPIPLILSSFFFFLTLLLWKYGYLIVPAVLGMTNIVEIREGYEIPPSQDYLLKKKGSTYYASMFVGVRIHESVSEKSAAEKTLFMESFERAISGVKSVTKFCVLASNIPLSSFVDEIKEKRGLAEEKRARLISTGEGHKPEVTRLEREIAMWNKQLERLECGERPMEVISYMMTTALGATREEAVGKARSQSKEIRSVVGNALNAEVFPLTGDDMKKCFEWEFAIPTTRSELLDSVY